MSLKNNYKLPQMVRCFFLAVLLYCNRLRGLGGQQINHQLFLKFFFLDLIWLAIINYHLVKRKNSYVLALKIEHFGKSSDYRALLLEINIV